MTNVIDNGDGSKRSVERTEHGFRFCQFGSNQCCACSLKMPSSRWGQQCQAYKFQIGPFSRLFFGEVGMLMCRGLKQQTWP